MQCATADHISPNACAKKSAIYIEIMSRKYRKRAANRPLANIDWAIVDEMLRNQCSGVEIAARFGISPDTLYKRVEKEFGCTFSAYSAEKKSRGLATLREKQLAEALRGNTAMLIWLGKQYLDQREHRQESAKEYTGEQLTLIKSLFDQIKELRDRLSIDSPNPVVNS
jgi:AraC-like DNA-binding protein